MVFVPPLHKDIPLPILDEITVVVKELHVGRKQVDKINRFGLYLKTEDLIIECFTLAITAALTAKEHKQPLIKNLKVRLEVAKRLIRLMWELKIITDKKYLLLINNCQTASKMTSGWLKYLQ